MGHLSAVTIGLVMQRHSTLSKTECSMTDDKTQLAHVVEDIIGYSWPLCPTVYGSPTLMPHVGPWGLIVVVRP
jgi:hypothetical protein